MVTVSRFSYLIDAQFAQLELGKNGIDSFIMDEYTTSMDWLCTNAIGGIRLQVNAEEAEDATKIIHELKEKKQESLPCGYCEGHNTYHIKLSPLTLILYFIGIFFPVKSGRIVCDDCGRTSKVPTEA